VLIGGLLLVHRYSMSVDLYTLCKHTKSNKRFSATFVRGYCFHCRLFVCLSVC